MTREITHMKAFALALDSLSKSAFSVGRIAPTPGLVNQFFNDSTGTGDHGEIDTAVHGTRAAIGFSWNLLPSRAVNPAQLPPLSPRVLRPRVQKVSTNCWSRNFATSFTPRNN
jgi:hypothetical protein